ncbi:MATE family efflux transporter [Belnapia sp. T6]|uniref:MATE family efflux transporter n=1 Tax=Belnapia mucosa TaxID=2804532 RepID=A0ABS1V3G1_9PROT|nr:MATE family efflux transporter [Belnapia mucosa]MBL6456221.1 MATE family efflux transporter [Belnapia mucosa]
MDKQTAPAGAARQGSRATLAEGPVARGLASATAPLAIALVVMFAIQLAEAWLTGLLGPHALAALGFAMPVVMTAMSFGIGLGAGATAVVARALGAGEAQPGRLSLHALLLAAAVAAGIALPCWIGADHLLGWLGAEGETRALAHAYLRLWLLGAVPLLMAMVALGIARAAGDMRFGGSALAGAGILAFLFDWPLVFGLPGLVPGLGMPGLAAASDLAWTVMLLASLWRLRTLGLLETGGRWWAGFHASTRRVLEVGLPAAATNAIIPVANGIFTALLAAQGSAAVAGFGLGSRVESLALTALFALSAVANPFAAQNAGAGRLDRVHAGMRASMAFCLAYGLCLALPLFLVAPWLGRLFTADPAVAASVALYLRILPWGFGAIGAISVANAAFNGLHRPMSAVAISLLRTFLLGVPLAWLGARWGGEAGTLAGLLAGNIAAGLLAAGWVLRATSPRPARRAAEAPA